MQRHQLKRRHSALTSPVDLLRSALASGNNAAYVQWILCICENEPNGSSRTLSTCPDLKTVATMPVILDVPIRARPISPQCKRALSGLRRCACPTFWGSIDHLERGLVDQGSPSKLPLTTRVELRLACGAVSGALVFASGIQIAP